jgi:Protein of unknown function (DUF1194)
VNLRPVCDGCWLRARRAGFAILLVSGAVVALMQSMPARGAGLALILAIDVSESVTADSYLLHRDRVARAFEDPRLRDAVSGIAGGIEVLVVEWSDPDQIVVTVDWQRVADAAGAWLSRMRSVRPDEPRMASQRSGRRCWPPPLCSIACRTPPSGGSLMVLPKDRRSGATPPSRQSSISPRLATSKLAPLCSSMATISATGTSMTPEGSKLWIHERTFVHERAVYFRLTNLRAQGVFLLRCPEVRNTF